MTLLSLVFILSTVGRLNSHCEISVKRSAETEVCIKNIPLRFQQDPRFWNLAFDPDRGTMDKQSLREAMAAIELERLGMVEAPVQRAERESSADFVDAKNRGFDVKAYSSQRNERGHAYRAKKLFKDIKKKLERSPPIPVFVDLTWLNELDRKKTDEFFRIHFSQEQLELIQYFELIEPQAEFKPRDSTYN